MRGSSQPLACSKVKHVSSFKRWADDEEEIGSVFPISSPSVYVPDIPKLYFRAYLGLK